MTPYEIRSARLSLGLSQPEMARLLEVDPVTWNRWERGKQTPQYPRMLELALHELTRKQQAHPDSGSGDLPD